MRRILASLCLCVTAYCSAVETNTAPLAFGMRPQEVANALGVPLYSWRTRRGDQVYVAMRSIPVPGFYPTHEGTALQFRNGRLTGWKQDWRVRAPWPF